MKIILVTDRKLCAARDFLDIVADAVDAGIDIVQIREKDLLGKALFDLTRKIVALVGTRPCDVFVNGRYDVALAAGAAGVHLGYDSIPPEAVRKAVGDRLKIGISIHSLEEAREAHATGADFAVLGPVFRTPSKEGIIEPLGVDRLGEAVSLSKIPLFAIGGIDEEKIHLLAGTGVEGVAMISAFVRSGSVRTLVDTIKGMR